MSRDHFIKMRGAWDTRHWIAIPALSHEADGLQVEEHLKKQLGVSHVQIFMTTKQIRVTYDQTVIDYDQILEHLGQIGFEASNSWWSTKKATWFQYLDINARESASAPSPPCCNNPKGLNQQNKSPTKSPLK